MLIASVELVAVASYQQITYERTVNEEIHHTFDEAEHEYVEPVAVRIQYRGVGPFGSPETITITASRMADGSDSLVIADELDRRITAATDREADVRVQFADYQRSDDSNPLDALATESRQEVIRRGHYGAR